MVLREIICPKLNTTSCLDILFEQLSNIPEYCEQVSLNFRNVDFITPSGALTLALVSQDICRKGKIILLSEVNTEILSYLERIDYFQTFPEKIILSRHNSSFESFWRSSKSHNLLEITPIPCEQLNNAYAQALFLPRAEAVLMNSFAKQANSIEKILTMISEIAGNIIHSNDQGYCTIQTYSKDGRVRIHTAIGDFGIGIRKSLLEFNDIQLIEEADFITHALKLGTSSKEGARGLGLAGVYESIQGLSGGFWVRSGTAGILLQGKSFKIFSNLNYVPGTQVEMSVRQ